MRNVVASISTFLISCVFLVGCKTPELEISSLGKVLPAPVLKGVNPLDQDNEGYGLFEGLCDPRTSALFVSFDKQLWSTPKAVPDVTGTNLPVSTVNDYNCADGTFKFYLTKADILTQWGIDIGDDNSNISAIYMKGTTQIGDTATLELRKSNQNGNGNVTTIVIEKSYISGFSGVSQCAAFELVARNAQGNENSVSVGTNVVLKESVNGSSFANAAFYSDSNCATTAVSNFPMAAKKSRVKVYYKFSDTLIDVIDGYKFKAEGANLAAQTNPIGVTVRSGDRLYLSMFSEGGRVLSGTCVAVNVNLNRFDNGYSSVYSDTMTIATADSNLKFYGTDSTCTNRPSTNEFSYSGSGSSNKVFYLKYSGTTNTTEPFVGVTVTATSGQSADLIPFKLQIDRSGKTTVKNLDIWMSDIIGRGTCESVQLVTANDNRTPVTATADVTVQLTAPTTGAFYQDSSCTTLMSSFTIATGLKKVQAYYRATPTTVNAQQALSGELTGYSNSSMTRNILVQGKASRLAVDTAIYNTSTGYGPSITQACQKVRQTIRLTDSLGDIPYANNFGLDLSLATYAASISGVTFYASESDCTNQLNGSSQAYASMPMDATAFEAYSYIRTPYFQGVLQLTTNYMLATPGVNLEGASSTVNVDMP